MARKPSHFGSNSQPSPSGSSDDGLGEHRLDGRLDGQSHAGTIQPLRCVRRARGSLEPCPAQRFRGDPYHVLDVAPRRDARTTSSGAGVSWPASTIPTVRRRWRGARAADDPHGAHQRRLRRAARPRPPRPLRRLARGATHSRGAGHWPGRDGAVRHRRRRPVRSRAASTRRPLFHRRNATRRLHAPGASAEPPGTEAIARRTTAAISARAPRTGRSTGRGPSVPRCPASRRRGRHVLELRALPRA